MASRRKMTTAVIAGVAAVALLLGGTFAWTSISQQAKNEATGVVNVGGRLHDDFNGKNKDVYVENFTDPYNDGQPIYARIRLDEYMEVGKDAGGIDVDNDGTTDATPVITGTSRNDIKTWKPHVPSASCEMCNSGNTCLIHDHWRWDMGGSTTFMPTFNKDKDSLEADVNGTYHGTIESDKVYYDDYVVYTTTAEGAGAGIAEDKKEDHEGPVYSVIGMARYDNDPDMEPNTTQGQYTEKEETHTAKVTTDATVITMAEWLANPVPDDYWVYDDDGWAYWANPIMPGEATGLLLSGIEMFKNPGEKCYYAINVVGQFATVNDWEKFGVNEEDEDYPSDEALQVLTKASENVPVVTVSNQSGVTLVKRGDEVTFSATTAVGAVSTLADSDTYDWVVLDENRKVTTTSTIEDNGDGTATLKVGTEEMSAGLYVAARSNNHGGAVGVSPVAVQLYTVNVTAENNATTVNAGKTLQFAATVVDSSTGEAENSGVTWKVTGGNGKAEIDESGLLTVDSDETDGAVLTVSAKSVNGGFVQTYTVTVVNKYEVTVSAPDDYVDPGKTLRLSAVVTQNGETVSSGVDWTVTDGKENTKIEADGTLTVDANETGGTEFTVTATSKADARASDTYKVTVNEYAITLTAAGDAKEVIAGYQLRFNAAVTKNGVADTSGVTWKVDGGSVVKFYDGSLLAVDKDEPGGTELTITATSENDPKVSATYKVTVVQYAVTVNEANGANTVDAGDTLDFSATVTKNGKGDTSGVTWSVENGTGSTAINEDGILTVDKDEKRGATLTVKATSKADITVVDTYTVTVNKYAVTVSTANNTKEANVGDTLRFTAALTKNGVADTSGVNWTVSGSSGASIDSNGTLTVAPSAAGGTTLTVKATAKEDSTVSHTYTVTTVKYEVTVTVANNPTTVDVDSTLQFQATVTKNGVTVTSGVNWFVSGGSTATINASGLLTVPTSEKHNTALTVTARPKANDFFYGTYPVTVYNGYDYLKTFTVHSHERVRIDGMEWYVLAKADGKALIWAAQVIPGKSESYFHGSSCAGPWHSSEARRYLNDEFLNSLTVLKEHVEDTTFYTADSYARTSYTQTTDKIFLPSEADIFGTEGGGSLRHWQERTYTDIYMHEDLRKSIDGEDTWLRSPGNTSSTMAQVVGKTGTLNFFQWSTKLRPAMWVDITE